MLHCYTTRSEPPKRKHNPMILLMLPSYARWQARFSVIQGTGTNLHPRQMPSASTLQPQSQVIQSSSVRPVKM